MYFYTFIYFSHIYEFFHTSIWIFCHTYIVCKIFSKFYLPDVVSVVFELFSIVSHVMTIFVACHTLVCGLVLAHLDYANAILADLPNVEIAKMQ